MNDRESMTKKASSTSKAHSKQHDEASRGRIRLDELVKHAIDGTSPRGGRGAARADRPPPTRGFELQLVASRGAALERVLVADVTGFCVHLQAPDRQSMFERLVFDLGHAARLSRRQLIWVIGLLPEQDLLIQQSDLEEAANCILETFQEGKIIRSKCEFGLLLNEVGARASFHLSAVTASMRREKMWWLAQGAKSVLDITNGRLWTPEQCQQAFGMDPAAMPRVLALRSQFPKASSWFDPHLIASAHSIWTRDWAALPSAVSAVWHERQHDIDLAEKKILGGLDIDMTAAGEVMVAGTESMQREYRTTYIAANIASDSKGWQFRSLAMRQQNTSRVFLNEGDALDFFRALRPEQDRWFVAGSIQFASWLVSHGVEIAPNILDPAWLYVAIYSDREWPESPWTASVGDLGRLLGKWLCAPGMCLSEDVDVAQVPSVLRTLDELAHKHLEELGLADLVDTDLAATLPVLARIYARGIPLIKPASVTSFDELPREIDAIAALSHERGNFAEAQTVAGARRGVEELIQLGVEGASVVRAMPTPQTTGRIGLKEPALHSLIKKGELGRLAGSMLAVRAPDELLRFDFNAFEPRVLAAMFGGDELLSECRQTDLHLAVTERIYGTSATRDQRKLVKLCTMRVLNQGTLREFAREQRLSREAAKHVFDGVRAAYSLQLACLLKVQPDCGGVRTLGWHRFLVDSSRAVISSTVVQGASATVFRAFLRLLEAELHPSRSGIVYYQHDSVIVQCPSSEIESVREAVSKVLARLENHFTEMKGPLLLSGDFARGTTWAAVR